MYYFQSEEIVIFYFDFVIMRRELDSSGPFKNFYKVSAMDTKLPKKKRYSENIIARVE